MERLTQRLGNKGTVVYTKGKYEGAIPAEMTNDDIRAVLKKLAAYEDLEEQGLLVRLPCKVGGDEECIDISGLSIIITEEDVCTDARFADNFGAKRR